METEKTGTLVQICDSPVLPTSITIRSLRQKFAGPTGIQPVMYRFRKNGKPTKVSDPEDLDMLLKLTRRTTGPGGKGIAHVQVFEVVTAEKQVQKMSPEDKLTRILRLLEERSGKSIEQLLLEQPVAQEDGSEEVIIRGHVYEEEEAAEAPDDDL